VKELTRSVAVLSALTIFAPKETWAQATGGPIPPPVRVAAPHPSSDPQDGVGEATDASALLFGVFGLISTIFMSGSNPPRDANGNVLPSAPPVTPPSHLEGEKLGTAAVRTPALQGALPAPSVPPIAASQLSPSVSHDLLDSKPTGTEPLDEHVEARDETTVIERQEAATTAGEQLGGALGISLPVGDNPRDFEQTGEERPLPDELRAGVANPQPTAGDPVRPTTGEMVVEHTDVRIPGVGIDLEIKRSYRSSSSFIGGVGYGWTHSFEQYLVRSAQRCALSGGATQDVIDWYTGLGAAIRFRQRSTGKWVADQDTGFRLTKQGSEWWITGPDGTTRVFDDTTSADPRNSRLSIGLFRRVVDRNANVLTVSSRMRPANRVTSVPVYIDGITDTVSHTFGFEYDARGYLTGIRGPSGLFAQYVVDARGDLVQAIDSENDRETYEYDFDATRASTPPRYPSAGLDDRCRSECGGLGFCGVCTGAETANRTSCEATCQDTNGCISGAGDAPSCGETCAAACAPTAENEARCEDLCMEGAYQLPLEACAALAPVTTCPSSNWCNSTVTYPGNGTSVVSPSGCCPRNTVQQQNTYQACLANPPTVSDPALAQVGPIGAACTAATPQIVAACNSICPSPASCARSCMDDSLCARYTKTTKDSSFSLFGFTLYFPESSWVYLGGPFDRLLGSDPYMVSPLPLAQICAVTRNSLGQITGYHADWDQSFNVDKVAAVDPATGLFCENPRNPPEQWECNLGVCRDSCAHCSNQCQAQAQTACRDKLVGARGPACGTVCGAYLSAACVSDCTPRCAAACANTTDCRSACGGGDYGDRCVDGCTDACVARNSDTSPRYGNPIDLNHNLLRIRDGEARLYLTNTYETDHTKPTFDRVTSQLFGTEPIAFRAYELPRLPFANGDEDQSKVDVTPAAVELCASVCTEDLSRMGGRERWVSVGDGDYLVFPDVPNVPPGAITRKDGNGFGVLPVFGFVEIERTTATQGIMRPAAPIPSGGLRMRTAGGYLDVSGGSDGYVTLADASSGLFNASNRLTMVRSGDSWRAYPDRSYRATRIDPPTACSGEMLVVPGPNGVELPEGLCEGSVRIQEMGRRTTEKRRGALSTARGSTTWSFADDAQGRRMGKVTAWSTAEEPWQTEKVGCSPPTMLDQPEYACATAIASWPAGTPRPDCSAPWETRGAGGGARPPAGGPSIDCWPDSTPGQLESLLPSSCVQAGNYRAERTGAPHIQPFAWATVVDQADGTSRTYYSAKDGTLLRVTDNDHHASVDMNYDGSGRLTGVRDVHGERTCIQYDEQSNPIRTVSLPSPRVVSLVAQLESWVTFGPFGLPTGIYDTGPNGSNPRMLTGIERDTRGNVRLVRHATAQADRIDEVVSDARGRVTDVYRGDQSARHVAYSATHPAMPAVIEDYERAGSALYSPGVSVLARTTLEPDALGRPFRISIEGGPSIERVLGSSGRTLVTRTRLDPVTRPTDVVTETMTYDSSGLPITVTKDRTATTLRWTLQGLLESVREQTTSGPALTRSSCTLYAAGKIDAMIDPDGRWTFRRTSPLAPSLVEIDRGIEPVTADAWSSQCAGNLVDGTAPAKETFSRVTVAADGRVINELAGPASLGIDRADTTATWTYDGYGRPVRRTWANGIVERWGYDQFDRQIWAATYSPTPGTSSPSPGGLAYDRPNASLTALDPTLAALTETSYDDDSRPIQRRSLWFSRNAAGTPAARGTGATPEWVTESWSYVDSTRMVSSTDAAGKTLWRKHDALGRLDQVLAGDGLTVLIDHDYSSWGQVDRVTTQDLSVAGGQRVQTHRFTPFGAPKTIEDAQGTVLWSADYNKYGEKTGERDRASAMSYAYDGFGRLTTTQRATLAGVTQSYELYGYTAAGRAASYKNGLANVTSQSYDAMGRVKKTTYPTGGFDTHGYFSGTETPRSLINRASDDTRFEYDGTGQLSRKVSRRGSITSETTASHDVRGLREARTWTTLANGTRVGDVTLTYERDSIGGKISEQSSLWPDAVQYTRDGLGRWTQLTIGGATGFQVGRDFDGLGRLDAVRLGPARVLADYVYPGGVSSPSEVRYANGAIESRAYDARGRITSSITRRAATTPFEQAWVWGPNDILARWDSVSPAPVGRRSFIFQADSMGRLGEYGGRVNLAAAASSNATAADITSWLSGALAKEQYVYDVADRLTQRTASGVVMSPTYGTDGRVAQWAGTAVTNDLSGRQTSLPSTTLEYDPAGRLSASVAAGGARTTYLYDPFGLLVGWDGPAGDTARFQYADGQIVRDRQGATTRALVPGEGLAPLAVITGGIEHTYIEGHGDRIAAALDGNGALAERYETLGNVAPSIWSGNGAMLATSGIGSRMLLGGQPWSPQLLAHRQGQRWYRPDWGRFLSPDPLGFADGPNVYAYGGMNAARWTDPSGLSRDGGGRDFIRHPIDSARKALDDAEEWALTRIGEAGEWAGEKLSDTIIGIGAGINSTVTPTPVTVQESKERGGGAGKRLTRDLGKAGIEAAKIEGGGRLLEAGAYILPWRRLLGSILGDTARVEQSTVRHAAELKPYGGPGGGHHIPAKKAFEDAAGYDINAALALPNAEMLRLGVNHRTVTGAQATLYNAFSKTGADLTWEVMSEIETTALIRGGMLPGAAAATVRQAIGALRGAGITGPTRIPWGAK